jgi:hypothetical protein
VASPKYRDSPFRTVLYELRHGTFLANALARSSRRKSRWNLLLLLVVPAWPALLIEGTRLARLVALALLRGRTIPTDLIWPAAIAPFFVYAPMLLATLLLAMVLVNLAIYFCVPPARRAMELEDKAFPGTDYSTQQPLLIALTSIILPVAFALSVLGQIFL